MKRNPTVAQLRKLYGLNTGKRHGVAHAREYLAALIAAGWEFPDALAKAAESYKVGPDELRAAYDEHEQEQHNARRERALNQALDTEGKQ